MELDFKTVRALSSPTRIRILHSIFSNETTTTDLSRELDKTKSTVSSHLSTLAEAELVEKEEVEGRRRVIYHPTGKAKAIVEGKEKKVKFSLTGSAISAIAGSSLAFIGLKQYLSSSTSQIRENAGMMAMDAATNTAEASSSEPSIIDLSAEVLFVVGAALLLLSVSALVYGLTINHIIGSED